MEENEAIEASVEMESMDYLSRGNGDEELWEYLPQQRRRGKGQNSGGDEYSKDGNSYLRGKMGTRQRRRGRNVGSDGGLRSVSRNGMRG